MTWQRIDENTYIDDTLVTCVEYQLFIDEMWEQGKYYQPDHWISYQFPKGQARKPILGVRYIDAVNFCNWLTKRETDEWNYLLPSYRETERFPIEQGVYNLVHGYWLINKGFAWIGNDPKDARQVTQSFDGHHDFEFDRFQKDAFNNAVIRPLDIDFAVEKDKKFIRAAHRALAADRDRIVLSQPFNPSRPIDIEELGNYAIDIALKLLPRPSSYFDIYVDILTLRERIAGRSPAFEGIRLVKERIR